MVKVNFTQAGGNLPAEGAYKVTLEKASEKQSADKKWDIILAQMIVNEVLDGPGEMEGRRIFKNYLFDTAPDADNGTSIYVLQKELLAFGADEDQVVEDGIDPVKDIIMCEDGLKGATAVAKVTHKPDSKNAEITRADVRIFPEDEFTV